MNPLSGLDRRSALVFMINDENRPAVLSVDTFRLQTRQAIPVYCGVIHSFSFVPLQTTVDDYRSRDDVRNKVDDAARRLCMILEVSTILLQGGHSLQFTAMLTINKIIDTCSTLRMAHHKTKLSTLHQDSAHHAAAHATDAQFSQVCPRFISLDLIILSFDIAR